MSAHCNTFLDDSEAEDDDIGTNSDLSSDVPDSPGSLKDFIDDSASNESSFAISEQPSPSTDDEEIDGGRGRASITADSVAKLGGG
ncbi:uncharacterized protein PG986_014428 [Apiospora aurea]|uniref:Uncharacterized protein n=1 Tax=Apiospora aurea TaxID=335848 RepID=A0ABR1PSZ1_9PEZI